MNTWSNLSTPIHIYIFMEIKKWEFALCIESMCSACTPALFYPLLLMIIGLHEKALSSGFLWQIKYSPLYQRMLPEDYFRLERTESSEMLTQKRLAEKCSYGICLTTFPFRRGKRCRSYANYYTICTGNCIVKASLIEKKVFRIEEMNNQDWAR